MTEHPNCMDDDCPVCGFPEGVRPFTTTPHGGRPTRTMTEHPNCMDDDCPVCGFPEGVRPDGFSTDTASCIRCNAAWHIEWDCSDDGAAGWIASMRIKTHQTKT